MATTTDDTASHFDVPEYIFYTPILSQRLDCTEMPVRWVETRNNLLDNDLLDHHLLDFRFLFTPATRISYFRAVNHHFMNSSFEKSFVNTQLLSRLFHPDPSTKRGEIRVLDRLQSSTNKYLVLEIRRDSVLNNAMDQLWRCQPNELRKPLKIRMGMDEGEEGVDHGGVQQEFFRVAMIEALDPKYGESGVEVALYPRTC